MFNPKQYRDKADEYSERGKTANGPNEIHEFEQLEKSFRTLADNEQWLADNHQKTVRSPGADAPAAGRFGRTRRACAALPTRSDKADI